MYSYPGEKPVVINAFSSPLIIQWRASLLCRPSLAAMILGFMGGLFVSAGAPTFAQSQGSRDRAPGDATTDSGLVADPEEQAIESDHRGRSVVGAILSNIRARLERQERPLGSRSWLCPYSPGLLGETDQIWTDSPVFLWQSEAATIAVLPYDGDEALWSAPLLEDQSSIAYAGERPLEAGQVYRWQLSHPDRSLFEATFSIMPAPERMEIQAQLEQLDSQSTDASDRERAVARADFFSERRLWSDALQELQTVRQADEEIDTFATGLTGYICNLPELDATASATEDDEE